MKHMTWIKRTALPLIITTALLAALIGAISSARAQNLPAGRVIFQDDFSTTSLWGSISDPDFEIGYEGDEYRIANHFFNSYVSSARASPVADIRVETEVRHEAGPNSGFFGVVCRWQDVHNYYALVIGGDRLTGIVRIQGGEGVFLARGEGDFDPAEANHLVGICEGNSLSLSVNGEALLDARDGTFTNGSAGLMTGTRGQPGVVAHFGSFLMAESDPDEFPPPVGIIPNTGAGERIYVVRSGDTLSAIALRFGTSVSDLMERNPHIHNPALIFTGQRLAAPDPEAIVTPTATPTQPPDVTPTPGPTPTATPAPPVDPWFIPDTGAGERLYTVRPGDIMVDIATRHNTTVAHLLELNPHVVDARFILPGMRLAVPDPEAVVPPDLTPATGRQVVSEDFSVRDIWFTADRDSFTIEYLNERYRIANHFENSFVSSIRTFNFSDVHSEVDAFQAAGPDSAYYGVVCRWQDVNNYFAAVISGDGTTGIVRVRSGVVTFLNQGEAEIDPERFNRVGANCEDSTLTLYLNGEPILQARDEAFPSGLIGLMVGTRGQAGADVHFDNLTAYIP
jgi:LysM repeat protein